ncbi:MAG: Bug family tripartite tricarboxylate transporter substrate binding protein [Xanthobacteraceae bacterium]
MTSLRPILLALTCLAVAPAGAAAQGAEGFFKGKVINLYIGFAPGGTYDYYSRLVARFMGKHIPGHPTIVAQSMPGAGSFQAGNFLYAVAPKDGTAFGMITQNAAIEDALRSPGVQFKAVELNWIGRVSGITEVHFTWKTSRVKTIQDAMEHETLMAGTGPGSPSEGYPKLLNALAGTKMKIISGYPGSTQGMLAMERGEVDGALTSWHTLNRTKQSWLENREINLLVQYAVARHRELPQVPTMLELARTQEAKEVFGFYLGNTLIGRSIVAPPGIPADRVKVLRDAFAAMLEDADFRSEIEKTQIEVDPARGEEVQKFIQHTAAVRPDIAERTRAILRGR